MEGYLDHETKVKNLDSELNKERDELENRVKYGTSHGCSGHDHTKEREVYELETKEKLKICDERFKLLGNAWFKEGQFGKALEQYQLIITYLDYTFPEVEQEHEKYKQLQLYALDKMQTCFFKLNDYKNAINYAKQVINLSPDHLNALLVWSKSERLLGGDFDLANDMMIKANKLYPENVKVLYELKALELILKDYKKSQKNITNLMFNN